ncbi:MAG TPA: hypothetical protein GXZ52_07965 [Clostridiales bacterium]|nr:hypothetical protein [Clostridiales bacterium]
MANRTKNTYGQHSVYGSLAYDFNNPIFFPETTLDEPVKAPAPPKTREQTAVRTALRTKQALAPFAIIGTACVAVLLVFSLMFRIQLTQVTDETVQLNQRFEELKAENAKLLIQYESAFNLTEIEEYAINDLGMQKPRSDQIYYVDSSAPDKAVVLQEETEDGGLLDRLKDFLALIGEYFE